MEIKIHKIIFWISYVPFSVSRNARKIPCPLRLVSASGIS
jgi:hypothetical protein